MLPKIFKPYYIEVSQLVRIGSLEDGGYILTNTLDSQNNFIEK